MSSRKCFYLGILIVLCFTGQTFSEGIKYFKLDKIVKVYGEIQKIRTDSKDHKNDFIIIELKSKNNKFYIAEVSPKWFYEIDMVKGDLIEIKGSLNIIRNKNIILTQSIIRQGEIYNFRDKLGFPLWRGKGKGMSGKGVNRHRRQKGKF